MSNYEKIKNILYNGNESKIITLSAKKSERKLRDRNWLSSRRTIQAKRSVNRRLR
jgi:hypothetical protein